MSTRDPMEALIEEALKSAGIRYTRDPASHLDFELIDLGVHIEVKRFHSPRISEQMSRAPNVIVAQGYNAVLLLASWIRKQ